LKKIYIQVLRRQTDKIFLVVKLLVLEVNMIKDMLLLNDVNKYFETFFFY